MPPPSAHAAATDLTRATPSSPAPGPAKAMPPPPSVLACLDSPTPNQLCDPLSFRVEGWIHAGAVQNEVESIDVLLDGCSLGRTNRLFPRSDVNRSLSLPPLSPTGFRLLAHRADAGHAPALLELRVNFRHGATAIAATVPVRFTTRNYREASFGNLLDSSTTDVWRRKNLHTSGPSLAEGSSEVAGLLQEYLPAPPSRVLDVGCGLGYYGKILRAKGYDWLGAEVKSSDCTELARQSLPYRQVDGRSLPFENCAFDAAICIEVLEHLDDPREFLAEVRRVAPQQLLVSVPNAELVPYLAELLATPLHMLDSDHKNFFTRWSLAALLREFYDDVEMLLHTRHPLSTSDGLPLFNHLFAIASTSH